METDKPLISVLMAVYDPNMVWLREQLVSLNDQTYPNLRLYVRDDCSPTVPYEEIQTCVAQCITAFPYTIARNEVNLGSNLTFQRLTQEGEGDYFAYCDQDDAWHADKIEVLFEHLAQQGGQTICSDVRIIDDHGTVIANSIQEQRKRHRFYTGPQLTAYLSLRNFVIGCTMLIDAPLAKEAVPFPDAFVHDHWLALCGSAKGAISVAPIPLVDYRQHQHNQTGILLGIHSKNDYFEQKISLQKTKLDMITARITPSEDDNAALQQIQTWATARCQYFTHPNLGDGLTTLSYRPFGVMLGLFELALPLMPECIFSRIISRTQKGQL